MVYYTVHPTWDRKKFEVYENDPGEGKRETIYTLVSRHRTREAAEMKAHKLNVKAA